MSIGVKINITTDFKAIKRNIRAVKKEIAGLPREAADYFRQVTPIDTGYARRHTFLNNQTIVGDYPYATYLEQGWSDQAPEGMVKPTQEYIDKRVEQINRKALGK